MLVGDAKVGEDRITVLEGRRALQYASQRTLYRLMHGAGSRKELHTLNARVLEEHGHTRDDLLSCPTVAMAAHDANLPVGTWVAIGKWGRGVLSDG